MQALMTVVPENTENIGEWVKWYELVADREHFRKKHMVDTTVLPTKAAWGFSKISQETWQSRSWSP